MRGQMVSHQWFYTNIKAIKHHEKNIQAEKQQFADVLLQILQISQKYTCVIFLIKLQS